jgi:molybdopterin-containing oxidoreductase family membrane subunit
MLLISIAVNIGMYTERFLIVATTQVRQFLPDRWGTYIPSLVEISIIVGTLAMFTTLFLVFVKVFPSISIYEIKETMDTPKKGKAEWQATH